MTDTVTKPDTPVTGHLMDGRGRVAKRTAILGMAAIGLIQTLQHPPAWLDTLLAVVQAVFASSTLTHG